MVTGKYEAGQGLSNRVLRGGSFNNLASFVRSANRNTNQPVNRDLSGGFRVGSTLSFPNRCTAGTGPVGFLCSLTPADCRSVTALRDRGSSPDFDNKRNQRSRAQQQNLYFRPLLQGHGA